MVCDEYDSPGSGWDFTLLAAAVVASVPFIAGNAVIVLHRNRRYFRAQGGAPLIITSSIAGLIWIVTTFIVNFHFPRNHGFLLICPLWSFWLQLTFGFWLWLACQVVRLLHLYRLCQNATSSAPAYSKRRWILVSAFALWIPGIIFAIAATSKDASSPSKIDTACANCKLLEGWKYCAYLILPLIYFSILAIVLYLSRNIKDYVMAIEYSHTWEYSFIMAVVIYLLYGATILTKSFKKIPGRCFLTFCICFLVFVNFWVRLGRPVCLCLFKNDSDMDDFEDELRTLGAVCLQNLSSGGSTLQSSGRTSSSLQYSDLILRAIGAARSEASECKERIRQLEQRKAVLSAKLKQPEGSAKPQFMSSPASARRL